MIARLFLACRRRNASSASGTSALSGKGERARAVGATAGRLVLRHILPNCVTPVLVQTPVLMAIAILVEAALSVLGVGVRPSTPSPGLMLSDGRGFTLPAPMGRNLSGPRDCRRGPRPQHAGRRPARLARPAGEGEVAVAAPHSSRRVTTRRGRDRALSRLSGRGLATHCYSRRK